MHELPSTPTTARGRVLAVDLGEARIGLAVSDEGRRVVRELGTVAAVGPKRDAAAIRELAEGLAVTQLVVGLPLLPSGEEGAAAARARERAQDLARRLQLPLALFDERDTSREAVRSLIDEGVGRHRRRRRAGRVDARAACLILEGWLAEQDPAAPSGGR